MDQNPYQAPLWAEVIDPPEPVKEPRTAFPTMTTIIFVGLSFWLPMLVMVFGFGAVIGSLSLLWFTMLALVVTGIRDWLKGRETPQLP